MIRSVWVRTALLTAVIGAGICARAETAEHPKVEADPWCNGVGAPNFDQPVEMILDDSRSMRGFMGDERSRAAYWKIVGDLFGDLVTVTRHFSMYRLSHLSEPMKDYQPASDAGFYGDSHTPLSAMFAHVADVGAPLVVVVSDLEQRESGQDINVLTAKLRDALASHEHVLLVGYKLHYYNASDRACDRFLYAMVMAADASMLDMFESETHALKDSYAGADQSEVSAARENGPWIFRSDAVVRIDLFADDYAGAQGWQQRNRPAVIECAPGRYVVRTFLVYSGDVAAPAPPIQFAVTAATKLRVHDPAKMTVKLCEEASAQKRQVQCPPGHVSAYGPHDPTGLTDENPLSFKITYDLGRIHGTERYRAYLYLGAGNVEAPQWVEAWSTNDARERGCTGSPPHARTLYLRSIIDAIIRSTVEHATFLSQSIDVRSEKP